MSRLKIKPIHPKETLKDVLDYNSPLHNKYMDILDGGTITKEIAEDLEKDTSVPKGFWINLQNNYDNDKHRKEDLARERDEKIAQIIIITIAILKIIMYGSLIGIGITILS